MGKATQRAARQRTAAQRNIVKEDVVVLDNEEQEAEIRALRKENAEANTRIRTALDFGVLMVLLITLSQPIRRPPSSSLLVVSVSQAALLLASLSPGWLPLLRPAARLHHWVVAAQLGLFVGSWVLLRLADAPAGQMIWYALPEVVAGAVELHRRGEREAEIRLVRLEGLKYDFKGA